MKRPDRDKFIETLSVPRETLEALDRYAEMLTEWNQRINLVSESTLPELWTRHFLDSAQLMSFIPDRAETLADMGSGAGFPGIVLSILGFPEVHLIESIGKKANFLGEVIRELGLPAAVHQVRIEEMKGSKADIITARALKSLPELMKYAQPMMEKESLCLFLKGKNVLEELTESAQSWTFDFAKCPSISDPSGSVLIIKNLRSKHAGSRKLKRKK